eukprot:366555-Chlamydomonas_euryale.AAC.21
MLTIHWLCLAESVWEALSTPGMGVVKQQAFHNFRIVKTTDAASAKALLESHEVGHYWDTAANYNRDEAPQVRLD